MASLGIHWIQLDVGKVGLLVESVCWTTTGVVHFSCGFSVHLTTCDPGSCGWPCPQLGPPPRHWRSLLSRCSVPGLAAPVGACGPLPGGEAGWGWGTVGHGAETPPSGSSAGSPLWPAAGDAGRWIFSTWRWEIDHFSTIFKSDKVS